MKKHLLTMSLALLSAAFLWSCQEQGSGPLGPQAPGIQAGKQGPPPGKGGRPVPKEITLMGGMVATKQLVEATDGDENSVHVDLGSAENINLQIDLQATKAACVTNGTDEDNLIDKLTDPMALPRDEFILNIFIKEQGEPTGSNIAVGWDYVFALRIDDASVISLGNGEYVFSGGTGRISDRTGKRKDHVSLTCPIQAGDEITVSLRLPV